LDEVDAREAPRAESTTPLVPADTRAQEPAAASNDDRLEQLENRLESLLTEIRWLKLSRRAQDMKRDPNVQPAPNVSTALPLAATRKTVTATMHLPQTTASRTVATAKTPLTVRHRQTVDGSVESVNLTRATYRLAPFKADEIAKFLRENLKDEIEFRVKDHSLIVTANSEDQTAIAGFIHLLQTRGAPATKADAHDEIRKGGSSAPKSDASEKVPSGIRDNDAFERPKSGDRDPEQTPKF
jgi:hypothetical protein